MISLLNLVLIASCFALTHGMDCYIKSDNVLENLLQLSCPPLFDSSKAYCCLDTAGKFYCCSLFDFAATYILIAVVVIAILSIVCSVVFCLCCPCCFCYKRRHAGNPI